MKEVSYKDISLTSGFWKNRQDIIKNTTIRSVYDRFFDTGRVEAFEMKWKDGDDKMPHIFWDSDIAKWIEGVALFADITPENQEKIEHIIDLIEAGQEKSGYFNIFFTVVKPEERFTHRTEHELYCAGHLIEAAVAYYKQSGRDRFLKIMCKYADYIEKVFRFERSAAFTTPGHEEIELALVKLYSVTNEKRYLELAKFFIDERGKEIEHTYGGFVDGVYDQCFKPVREQETAEGHCVRACYLYSGMADIARIYGDEDLKRACEMIFDDIVNHKMYITGGIGSSHIGEAFTISYDLPNMRAYTETCAAIALAFFAHRMQLIENKKIYAEVIERVIYNGFLSGISLDGKSFFYENPLEIIPELRHKDVCVKHGERLPITERLEVFDCSCCPPNVIRFVAAIGENVYTYDENTVYVHQFMSSEADFDGRKVIQQTNYPADGKVTITYQGKPCRLAVRVPDFCEDIETEDGYIYFDVEDGMETELDFTMPVYFVESNPLVYENCGRIAVMRGPVVYCAEGKDNGKVLRDITLCTAGEIKEIPDECFGLPVLEIKAFRRKSKKQLYYKKTDEKEEFTAKLIPYYAFANRGESEMLVWLQ
ncbi:MAG: glycoside hydrolase family 127 protein [Clostridia bacterium]|nr:glycoside hydrolase family 127 protein [Clostridia bacterium]